MEDRTASNTTGEQRPLLGPKPDSSHDDNHHRRRVILVSFVMVILVDLAAFFLEAPQTKILEGIVCRRYHEGLGATTPTTPSHNDHDYAQHVQPFTWLTSGDPVRHRGGSVWPPPRVSPGDSRRAAARRHLQDGPLAARRPWGAPRGVVVLARHARGRRAVASAMIFLVVADVAPPSQRANLFFLLTACGLVGEVVATPISALLMARDPWIPYFIYTLLTLLGGLVPLVFLPETLQRTSPETQGRVCDSSREEDDSEEGQESPPRSSEMDANTLTSLAARFRPLLRQNIIAVLSAFFVAALGRQSTSFFLQYIRQRFDWTYEKVRRTASGILQDQYIPRLHLG
ncbi:hypothetical protein G7054_g10500 [Neopestalotiopsis clavispora]|nr:hypothetical protein G7054_g10500 [Neopestalotiopsis clavispora]